MSKQLNIIGELINNAYARARRAWADRNLEGFQNLAKVQTNLGARYLTLNIDGTSTMQVKQEEMLDFLPTLVPALQQATSTPISFDNPAVEFHRVGLSHYDRTKSPAPILNSLAASRDQLDEMIDLVREFDTRVIVIASEKFTEHGGSEACLKAEDVHQTAAYFVDRLKSEAARTNDDIIIDPGLAPVGADTYGLINVGLDGMQLIRQDAELHGCHMMVGLSNFAWGTPKHARHQLENAYLTLAMENGLDYALANPEKAPRPLEATSNLVAKLRAALEEGRPSQGVTQEEAGYDQAEAIMDICDDLEQA
ncbi:dihydropteroate synthase [Verrucomicrobiaceae bacterium N1E253]|uniref:Dihydropteroate synthase n=1 Tax=Oceaniferula marina TaxID=2748318 RepID=A0A851GIR6_9BACT|nr:dihydropteroate synthase [Oceaniferula marina]NWK54114.1 dihydropteroate synthase [Oceaniferula marina]